MKNTTLETIKFHNQQLIVLNYQDKPYVAMKPVCENIGLDWHAQLNRINRHNILSKGVVMIATPTNGGVQKFVCLPISMINGWLFGIETSRVKPEIRATLEQYQLECFDVLYNHFMPKVAQQFPNINLEQQLLQQLLTIQEYYCRVFNLYYDCLADFLKKNSPHIHYNFYTALDKIHINVNLSLNSLRRELNAKSKIGN